MKHRHATRLSRVARALVLLLAVGLAVPAADGAVRAQSFEPISGEGSSWAGNAIQDMQVNVQQFGMSVEYTKSSSSNGRARFIDGTVDFAASDIPFQIVPEDGTTAEEPTPGSYVYIPVVAGGTAFVYNLKIGGRPVTNLRLSGENVAKIFTGVITQWNDPAIQADNPGIVLPARQITPVVRSDGSGSTAQFTKWMIATQPNVWNAYCERVGRAGRCGSTSIYPTIPGMLAQGGDDGIVGTVVGPQNEGTIGYANYSYAINAGAPVAKVLNTAGFYTEPTPENVAVSLLQAEINLDASDPAVYLTQILDRVYTDADPRNYQLSSYSYFILPTTLSGSFSENKGYTLSSFANYAMCQAQQNSAALGYSPMPIALVRPALEQIRKIPGAVTDRIDVSQCDNPTFDPANPDDPNRLATLAPLPQECDRQGTLQCPDGTGGLRDTPTAVSAAASGAATGGGGVNAGTGGTTGGATDDGGAAGGDGTTAGSGGAASNAGGRAATTASSGGSTATGSTGQGAASTGGAVTAGGVGGADVIGSDGVTTGGAVLGDGGVPSGELACDPDTGECVASAAVGGDASVGGAVTGQAAANGAVNVGAITPTNLDGGPGVGQAVLVILILLLVVGLIIGPALAWRHLANGAAA